MNPYRDTSPRHDVPSSPPPPPCSPPDSDSSHDAPLPASLSPAVIQTGHTSVMVWSYAEQDGGEAPVQSGLTSRPPSPSPAPAPTSNPYPAPPSTPPAQQVSVIIPSPDLRPSPLPSQCSQETCPDLECSICFSQFNNVFRCPKMLQCKHTFCLECLARINVKSAQPNAIQCPLCRGLTPLPALGLPRLATDSDVLSCLPAAMQRVYSIRFLRSKGKLQVKRSAEGHRRWGQRPLTSLRTANRSLDVGLPSPPIRGHGGGDGGEADGVGGALFRLTGVPACRAFLLTSVVMMMVLLTGIIIFLLTNKSITNRSGF